MVHFVEYDLELHLSFKMIEPELAFADLNDDMACATAYLQYVVCYFHIICQLGIYARPVIVLLISFSRASPPIMEIEVI